MPSFGHTRNNIDLLETIALNATKLNSLHTFSEKWRRTNEGSLGSLPIPTEFGGTGLNALTTAQCFSEIGRNSVDGGFNFSLAAHTFAGCIPLMMHAAPEMKKRILPLVSKGEFILANAMTEPSSGSNAFAMKTTAEKKGKEYVLNGVKTFCTNAPVANGIVVYALTDASKGFFGGITCFLLEKGKHDFKVGPEMQKTGLKNSPMAEVFLNDVKAGEENIIGKVGGGAMIFHESMNWERACIAAMHAGTMTRICELTKNYINQKESGGKTIASYQGAQFRIAEMYLRTGNAKLLAEKAAWMIQENKDAALQAAQAKIYASEAFQFVAQEAIQLHGANGILDTDLMNYLSDAQASSIYSGPNDVLRSLIASKLS